ncbi:thioesterase family protein [Acuticoccus sp. M5D2P5]|uniref:thioesterase family protein n=1 Tax=Acuticoccus kalidii TaxID=2910977 RepID=UPI001F1EA880|nr:thioesterase family protein [Acuticoccus kalidii]MCF3935454.1 thioesterase family protein [Acuticoccus kalidii]
MLNTSGATAPLVWSDPFSIELGWLDANGHLNMAYYHVMFDRTVDLALEMIGLGDSYRDKHNASVFNVETHVVYRREVQAHDKVSVSFQLLSRDQKRLHVFQTMVLEDGELAATSESLFVHVDLNERRSAAIPADAGAAADAMIEAHKAAGEPPMAGRRISPLS